MKKTAFIVFSLWLVAYQPFAQVNYSFERRVLTQWQQGEKIDTLALFFAPHLVDNQDSLLAYEKITRLLRQLIEKQKTFKNQRNFVEYVFKSVRKDFFKTYHNTTSFSKTILIGEYDCLTGSMLYAYLFSQLGYKVQIQEMDFHIYLIITVNDRRILIESTDKNNGMIDD